MPAQIRIPYYRLDFASFFALEKVWKLFDKAEGCKPLKNPQAAILMERKPPPLPSEKTAQPKKAEKAKPDPKSAEKGSEAKKAEPSPSNAIAGKNEKSAQPFKVSNDQVKSTQLVEECKAPPPFDMLDLPDAMEKMGFTVAAKLSRRWFNSRRHEIPNTEDGFEKPVDILKGMFGEMRKQDVYYSVRNSDYHKWPEKFGRGGDFAIYTEPKKIKLPKPIKFTLEEICKPAKLVYGK